MDDNRLMQLLDDLDKKVFNEADKLEVHGEYRQLTEAEAFKAESTGSYKPDIPKLLLAQPEWCDGWKWGMLQGARRVLQAIRDDEEDYIKEIWNADGISAPAPGPATIA